MKSKASHKSHGGHKDAEGSMHKESKMSHKGVMQGDMSPVIEDYQRPTKSFSQEGFSKTTEYVERQDKFVDKAAADIRKQAYEGRYS